MNPAPDDDRFDHAMRALHREAVAQVSPDVRRRLRDARSQTRPRPAVTRFGWPAASVFAAALVLALALPLRSPAPDAAQTPSARPSTRSVPTTVAVPPASAATSADAAEATVPSALAALEESPDFYLWLASSDAGPAGALP